MKLFKYDINLYYPAPEGKSDIVGVDGYVLAESRETAKKSLYKKYEKKNVRVKIMSLKSDNVIETRRRS